MRFSISKDSLVIRWKYEPRQCGGRSRVENPKWYQIIEKGWRTDWSDGEHYCPACSETILGILRLS